MADREEWLPPQAPDSAEPPRFDSRSETRERWTPPVSPAAPAQAPPAAPAQPPPAAPAEPVFVQARGGGAGNGLAVAALVLGILGLGLLVLSLGLGFFLSLICSGAAWVCGAAARRRLRAGVASGGEGQAKAGFYLGIAGVALGVVAMVVWIVLIAQGFDLQEWQRELERELERQRERRRDGDGDGELAWLAGAARLARSKRSCS